jgi:hypothetical protein
MTILGSVLLAAAMAAPADAARSRVCGGVVVSSAQRQTAPRGTFSASKTLDLSFQMPLRNVDDDAHLVTFHVYTPKGHLYQEIQVVHRAKTGRRGATISASLPVAGTAIPTNSLYGRWSVVPHFDGSPRPCAAASVFTIAK